MTTDASNPFATRFIRPGSLPFVFPAGESAESIVERLKQNGWRGAIVGPHGSGKSSLLSVLLPQLQESGRELVVHQLHQGERGLPWAAGERTGWSRRTLVVIDGYEQLGWLARAQLAASVWWTGCGLVVTSHGPTRLPTLIELSVSSELAVQLAGQLLAGRADCIPADRIAQALARHRGNLREAFLDLYDLYQQRNPAAAPDRSS